MFVAACLPTLSFGQASDVPGAPVVPGTAPAPRVIITGGGSLNNTDTPTTVGRLFRDGNGSTCAAAKSFPGAIGSPLLYAYDIVPYTNSGPSQCITLQLNFSCAGGNTSGVFLAGYSGIVNPNDLSVGYLGDAGNSSSGQQMNLLLGAGQSINLMVGQVNDSNTSSQCTYELRDNLAAPIPTLNQWMTIILGLLVATAAVVGFRRHRIR